ncbi:MAG: hypothetical protein DRP66_02745 [Planctomycetota bacterium]|nr:MAG: hypothetical protein DRP66_02745 [Planctomycetota bacterium]
MCTEDYRQVSSSVKVAGSVRMRTPEQARSYEAGRFSGSRRGRRLDRIDKAFAEKLYSMVGSESCIVDVPCGSGRFYDIFCGAKSLVMIDCDPNMLGAARESHDIGENAAMLQADIGCMPLEDNSADLCFSMRLFHHIETEEIVRKILRELARVSRRYVAVGFYNTNSWRYLSRKIRGKKVTGHYYSFHRMAAVGREVGLEIAEKHPRINLLEQQCLVLFRKIQDT